ncbi:peptide chain release factor H [Sphingomonas kyeonggiensis]|uniref:Peptide chain release factor n=1 Tax=Sphingomonas kyeonggiensis TaxID=1268553 RepID=A0A7W6JQN0_9SPHN|nr:peptide chain release factor H [Sphingomonas kyeonggiensis]MBB4097708.1 peptide chain release factor [Sphingomonas kyeonggiensis]
MTELVLHVSSGQGPRECEWVVEQLVHAWAREAQAAGLVCEPVEPVTGPAASVLLRVSGEGAPAFADARTGTIRWIGTSPFRPRHKRRNWFVGVSRAPTIEEVPELRDMDITYQAMRASGPGGQHVNRTDSAVRATHLPTGLTSFSQDQRSQHANRGIARLKLALLFEAQRDRGAASGKRGLWDQNRALERGNAVRTYRGEKFSPV